MSLSREGLGKFFSQSKGEMKKKNYTGIHGDKTKQKNREKGRIKKIYLNRSFPN